MIALSFFLFPFIEIERFEPTVVLVYISQEEDGEVMKESPTG